ncbi:hypothetical protein HY637_01610 [Candidatus Woesearchaeota archaeon]|nr:hypothetical protein [Candidatus Woesearchaeota archaeon]
MDRKISRRDLLQGIGAWGALQIGLVPNSIHPDQNSPLPQIPTEIEQSLQPLIARLRYDDGAQEVLIKETIGNYTTTTSVNQSTSENTFTGTAVELKRNKDLQSLLRQKLWPFGQLETSLQELADNLSADPYYLMNEFFIDTGGYASTEYGRRGVFTFKSSNAKLDGHIFGVSLEFAIEEYKDPRSDNEVRKVDLRKFRVEGPLVIYDRNQPFLIRHGEYTLDAWLIRDESKVFSPMLQLEVSRDRQSINDADGSTARFSMNDLDLTGRRTALIKGLENQKIDYVHMPGTFPVYRRVIR